MQSSSCAAQPVLCQPACPLTPSWVYFCTCTLSGAAGHHGCLSGQWSVNLPTSLSGACVFVQYTMRVVSGGIAGSAFIIMFLGVSGLINLLLQYISPITGASSVLSSIAFLLTRK